MRDRLIELINETWRIEGYGRELQEKQADYLLANGVIIPPCKVGDILYSISGCRYVIYLIMFDGGTLYYKCGIENTGENTTFTEYDIGQKVFLTRAEAEAALKARENK